MKPRRSRFSRIYRRITRGTPNRRSQWQQIVQLRPQGSPGRPVTTSASRAFIPYQLYEPLVDDTVSPPKLQPAHEAGIEWINPELDAPAEPQRAGSGVAMGVVATSLFLLACAFAALSGYMFSYHDPHAWLGIAGALVSLASAGFGLCARIACRSPNYGTKFMTVAAVCLGCAYTVLLCMGVPH